MDKIKVLFVCIHNSARSQMAEAFLNRITGDRFEAESAGLEPGKLNPIVVEVMKEKGIDISKNITKSVFEFLKQGKRFNYVITVCDESKAEQCPIFSGTIKTLHMGFEDPSGFTGTNEEKLTKTRIVRDEVERKINAWAQNVK